MMISDEDIIAKFMGTTFTEYDTWDNLMPVIEKVEQTIEEGDEFDSRFSFYYIGMAHIVVRRGDDTFVWRGNATREDRLEKNYEACVEFIKWYNQIKGK